MSTTPKLDKAIQLYGPSVTSDALAEIREHLQRMPAPQAACAYVGPLWAQKHIDELMAKPAPAPAPEPEPTRYPSEIETRLIELCTEMIADLEQVESPIVVDAHKRILAAIKRDLGLPPTP